MEVREQFLGVNISFLTCEPQYLSSGSRAWLQVPVPTEPSSWSLFSILLKQSSLYMPGCPWTYNPTKYQDYRHELSLPPWGSFIVNWGRDWEVTWFPLSPLDSCCLSLSSKGRTVYHKAVLRLRAWPPPWEVKRENLGEKGVWEAPQRGLELQVKTRLLNKILSRQKLPQGFPHCFLSPGPVHLNPHSVTVISTTTWKSLKKQ